MVALATSLAVLSVSGSVGVAALIGWVVGGWVAWLLGSLLATLVYLAIAALEVALARGLRRRPAPRISSSADHATQLSERARRA